MLSGKKITFSRRVAATFAFIGAIGFSAVLLGWPNLQEYRQVVFVDAAARGNIVSMKMLLVIGADANGFECQTDRCRTPVIAAAQAGQYEAVQLLVDRAANVNIGMKRGQTALMFASYYGHSEVVKLLLASGADVNASFEGDTALTWAKQRGHAEIVNLLIVSSGVR